MGGDHHHHSEIKIPDYRIYKVSSCSQLVQVEQALARIGLKDPWLRNEVWRYDPAIHKHSQAKALRSALFRGFTVGLGLLVVTIAVEKAFGIDWHDPRGIHKGEHGHGHGHEDH